MTLLVAQLIASFFAPVFAFGNRNVYVSDLTYWLCFVAGSAWFFRSSLIEQASKARVARFILVVSALMGAVFAHGYFRPLFRQMYYQYFIVFDPSNQVFRPGREIVVLFRLWSWIVGGRMVAAAFAQNAFCARAGAGYRVLMKTLAVCLALELALMVAARLSPGFQTALGHLYRYDPTYDIWGGRAYGSFASPVEAGVAMGLGGLIAAASGAISPAWTAVAALSALLGLLLTKTATALGALFFAGLFVALGKTLKSRPWTIAACSVVPIALASVLVKSLNPALYTAKINDFISRMIHWEIDTRLLFSRADLALLGLGFTGFSTDNMVFFVSTRAGLLGLGVALFALWKILGVNWAEWTWRKRAVLIYLFFGAALFDTFIYRNVVYMMIAAGMPMLILGRKSASAKMR